MVKKPLRISVPPSRAGTRLAVPVTGTINMGSVLAIEPSADRAAKLRAVAQPHFGDSLTLVDSVNSAFAAMHRSVPQLILISPSLPPDKKAELIAGLRALPHTTAVQTLTT